MPPTDFYTVEDGELVRYLRRGECNQCGECCGSKNTIRYNVQVATDNKSSADAQLDTDWTKWEGWTMFWAQGLWWYFKIIGVEDNPCPCTAQDPATKLCAKWDSVDDFPAICRYWPFRESDPVQFPMCGFNFEKVRQPNE